MTDRGEFNSADSCFCWARELLVRVIVTAATARRTVFRSKALIVEETLESRCKLIDSRNCSLRSRAVIYSPDFVRKVLDRGRALFQRPRFVSVPSTVCRREG